MPDRNKAICPKIQSRKEEIMNTALVTAIGSFSADIVIKNLKKDRFRVVGCGTVIGMNCPWLR